MPYRVSEKREPPKRRGLQECFACHTAVHPKTDGKCPACGASFDEVSDDGRRSLTIPHGADLPGFCARCGAATEHRVLLRPSRTDDRAGGISIGLRIAIGLLWPLRALRAKGKKRDVVSLQLPLCEGCEPVAPEHVDFDRRELTLVVHRNLRGAALAR